MRASSLTSLSLHWLRFSSYDPQEIVTLAEQILENYLIRSGSRLDRALLLKFLERGYADVFPGQDYSHLARTVEQYFSPDTPLWWVDYVGSGDKGNKGQETVAQSSVPNSPVACLWAGNAIDQLRGSRHTHIFLLYVIPEHRRRGLGTALMKYVENWARKRGDRQIALQVFQSNQPAINLYSQLGYETQSLWMIKPLAPEKQTGGWE